MSSSHAEAKGIVTRMRSVRATYLAIALSLAAYAPCQDWNPKLHPTEDAALLQITENGLRAHVSFLASDLLEGRGTPSRGLDVAAEYIAAQFRRAGLDPGGAANSYFQGEDVKKRGSDEQAPAKNVVGILRGSDPALADTYIVVGAHYDHLGMRDGSDGDNIFNGANDDASGTAALIELAIATGSLKERPKRTIVFVAFYGEERGMLGSRFFVANPPLPLNRCVAMLNLEHVGRSDDVEGATDGRGYVTGFGYSEVSDVLASAGTESGFTLGLHARNSDGFFPASDNVSFALHGVPAHTVCTAFIFPDYHKVSDHWEKLNYPNMLKATRTVCRALFMLAQSGRAPVWKPDHPHAARYHEAWRRLMDKSPDK